MTISAITANITTHKPVQSNFQAAKSNVSFKGLEPEKDVKKDAIDFTRAFFNMEFENNINTKSSAIRQKDASGKIIKEIILDAQKIPMQMTERNEGQNTRVTYFEKDGATVKEYKEYAADDENILLKHFQYNEENFPYIEEYNRNGILIKKEEHKKAYDQTNHTFWLEKTLTSIYDEKTGKIIEHIEALPIMAPRVTKYKYNDKNQLIQTTLTNRDYREITDYNPQTELPQHSERHYFSQEENPEARSASYGADYYTEYVYDSHNRLIKEKTFNKRDNRFEYGKKYNPETGKTILEASRGHATHYDKDGDIDIERTTSYPNTVKTLYYDKEQAVPYREIYKDGNNYRIDRIYKPDKEKYNNNLHRIESQKLLTRTHSDLDEYHFKKLINRFTHWNVISIQKDYTDDNYDIYKIKLPKNSQQDDF